MRWITQCLVQSSTSYDCVLYYYPEYLKESFPSFPLQKSFAYNQSFDWIYICPWGVEIILQGFIIGTISLP